VTRLALSVALLFGIGASTKTLGAEAPARAQHAPCATLARCRVALAHARLGMRWQRAERHRLERALRWQRLHASGERSVSYALRLAAAFTGASLSTLTCIASGETGGTFDPGAYNPSGASGLFQFEPASWSSMGVPGFSAFDPLAAALAAARQIAAGDVAPWRGGEEGCWS